MLCPSRPSHFPQRSYVESSDKEKNPGTAIVWSWRVPQRLSSQGDSRRRLEKLQGEELWPWKGWWHSEFPLSLSFDSWPWAGLFCSSVCWYHAVLHPCRSTRVSKAVRLDKPLSKQWTISHICCNDSRWMQGPSWLTAGWTTIRQGLP